MEEKVLITVNVKVTQDDLTDILTTALEGGINYWCAHASPEKKVEGMKFASDCLKYGIDMWLWQYPEDDDAVKLTAEGLMTAIKWYLTSRNDTTITYLNPRTGEVELDCAQIDAELADILVQYAVFGEIVYG